MKKITLMIACSLSIITYYAGAAENSARLLLDAEITGRLTFRDKTGLLITEIVKTAEKSLELGLEPGYYEIILQRGDSFYRSEVTLPAEKTTSLAMAHFKLLNGSDTPPAPQKPVPQTEAAAKSADPKKPQKSTWSFHPVIWFDSMEFLNFGFKTGPRYFYLTGNFSYSFGSYNQSSIWSNPNTFLSNDRIIYRGGIGVEIPLGPFYIDIEGLAGFITDLKKLDSHNFKNSSSFISQARIIYGVKFVHHFSIYFGFSYDYIYALTDNSPVPYDINSTFFDFSDPRNIHKLGAFAGIQF